MWTFRSKKTSSAQCATLHRPRRGYAAYVGAVLVCAALIAAISPVAYAQEMLVSAAISLKEAMEEMARNFQPAHPGITLRFNFGASGDLQKQIEAGAPVDLFVSAG